MMHLIDCCSNGICLVIVCSLLYVETADRPGLLVDLVKIVTDINVNVESGEFDTEVTLSHRPTAAMIFPHP